MLRAWRFWGYKEWEAGNGQRHFVLQGWLRNLNVAWPSWKKAPIVCPLSKPAQLSPPLLLPPLCRDPKPAVSFLLPTFVRQKEGKSWKIMYACKNLYNSSNCDDVIPWLSLVRFVPSVWQREDSLLSLGLLLPLGIRLNLRLSGQQTESSTSQAAMALARLSELLAKGHGRQQVFEIWGHVELSGP